MTRNNVANIGIKDMTGYILSEFLSKSAGRLPVDRKMDGMYGESESIRVLSKTGSLMSQKEKWAH
jgi:hypothetical protein